MPSYSRIAVLDQWAQQLLQRLPLEPACLNDEEQASLGMLARAGLVSHNQRATIPPPAPPRTLVAWLHTTSACNLRCHYCYVAKAQVAMSATTARQAVDTVMTAARRHGYPCVALKYAGGEPTLQLPLILATHAYAQSVAATYGLRLSGAVLSNGVLVDEAAAAQLATAGLSLMVSLDGSAPTHDQQRPTVGGRGTYAAAWQGLRRAQAAGVAVTVGITVTAIGLPDLPTFVNNLLAADLPFGISFYREPLNSPPSHSLCPDPDQLIATMQQVYATVAQHPPRWSVLGALLDRTHPGAAHQRSCAAGEHYLVIDQHGKIASCQMTLDQPVSQLTAYDPLSELRQAAGGIYGQDVDMRDDCRTCQWRYWCGGGCAVLNARNASGGASHTSACSVYKALFPALLRLEGQRVLYWHQQQLLQFWA
ncbi:MAG: radical SAM protein [Oscillochloridaceae bacterium umkhey_bin13]